MCKTFNVDALSDLGIISLVPLYMIPSLHVIWSLKYQYDCILRGQSLIVLGHPSWTVFASNFNDGSFSGFSQFLQSLWAGRCYLCNLMYWDLFNVVETVIVVWMFGLDRLNSGEGICYHISFPLKYSICTLYWASLRSSLCSLGLDVAIVFFQMLVNGW